MCFCWKIMNKSKQCLKRVVDLVISRRQRRKRHILCLLKAINQNSLTCNEIDLLECHLAFENQGI